MVWWNFPAMIMGAVCCLILAYIVYQYYHQQQKSSIDTCCFFCNKRTIVMRPCLPSISSSIKEERSTAFPGNEDSRLLRPVGSRIDWLGPKSAFNQYRKGREGAESVKVTASANPFASQFDQFGRLRRWFCLHCECWNILDEVMV